jgi:hypothetical protein
LRCPDYASRRRVLAQDFPERALFVSAVALARGGRPVCCVSSVPLRGAAAGVEFLRLALW